MICIAQPAVGRQRLDEGSSVRVTAISDAADGGVQRPCAVAASRPDGSPADWQPRFEAMLPVITERARYAFRHRGAEDRDECVAAAVALAFQSYVRLVEQGRADTVSANSLAHYAVLAVRCGRAVGGSMNHRDVLSVQTKLRHGISVTRLGSVDQEAAFWQEALRDNRRSPVADQAAFRIDFPAWLRSLSARNRRIARALAIGLTTGEAAECFGLSWGRISQLRRELAASWRRFHERGKQARDVVAATA